MAGVVGSGLLMKVRQIFCWLRWTLPFNRRGFKKSLSSGVYYVIPLSPCPHITLNDSPPFAPPSRLCPSRELNEECQQTQRQPRTPNEPNHDQLLQLEPLLGTLFREGPQRLRVHVGVHHLLEYPAGLEPVSWRVEELL